MPAVRIQRKRTMGFKLPPNCMYVGRPTKWGNPFRLNEYADVAVQNPAKLCVQLFREISGGIWDPTVVRKIIADSFIGCGCPECDIKFDRKTEEWAGRVYTVRNAWLKRIKHHPIEMIQLELRGKDLCCWCPLDQPCHADVLLEIANEGEPCQQ